MFTGIIETHTSVISTSNDMLFIKRPESFKELSLGQSIAVNGACLSVMSFSDTEISFSVLSETFRKTNLANSKTVNVERAMLANGRFEGHIVLGHVDDTIPLLEKKQEISGIEYIFGLPKHTEYCVEKGSITLNGVSLTIGNMTEKTFSVYLIPLTLEHTNLGALEIGEKVTIEYDYIAKLIQKKIF